MQSSHPVEVEVQHPDDINAIFDAISYAKGASIIRMVAEYIGLDNFWKGMRIYLNRHAYGNAVSNECWMALEEASDKPIVKFMQPWTQKVGFPIILLKIGGAVLVERFLADGSDGLNTTAWPIPVTAIVEGIVDVQGPWVINGPEGDELEILRAKIDEWSSSGKWFKLNANQTVIPFLTSMYILRNPFLYSRMSFPHFLGVLPSGLYQASMEASEKGNGSERSTLGSRPTWFNFGLVRRGKIRLFFDY
jgi:hypothetical protein